MDDELWRGRQDAARMLGISAGTFDLQIQPKLPQAAKRGAGRTLQFSMPAALRVLVAVRIQQKHGGSIERALWLADEPVE